MSDVRPHRLTLLPVPSERSYYGAILSIPALECGGWVRWRHDHIMPRNGSGPGPGPQVRAESGGGNCQ